MAAEMTDDQALIGLDQLELEFAPKESRASRLGRKAWEFSWPKALAVALVLVVWELISLSGWKSAVLAGPATVLSSLFHQALHATLWSMVGVTMLSAAEGFALSLLVGGVIGLVVARITPLRAAVGSIITGLQTMPSIAWVPFAIILFGLTTSAIMFMIVLGSAPSIANGIITGIDYTPPLLLRAGRTMGLRGVTLYRYLIIPASLPSVVAGLKQAWAFGWRSLMAAELLVNIIGQTSLGEALNVDQQNLDFVSATGIIIVILIIGMVVDSLFTKADLTLRRSRGLLDPAAV